LIDALLALAQGQRGLGERRPVDLSEVVGEAMRQREQEAAARGLTVQSDLAPAVLAGDRPLLERLTCNLLDNALRHNLPGGTVGVTVGYADGEATLVVANTGPPVPADEVPRLLAPFQRMDRERVGRGDGLGLGLSIVAAIASAHGARLTLTPRAGGGLEVEVRFAARTAPTEEPGLGTAGAARRAAAA
ncbi:MAG: sensor histidine kinase, partial [Solirubrobacteraceae bacterium]